MGFFGTARKKRELENQIQIAKLEKDLARTQTATQSLYAQQSLMDRVTNSGYSNGGASHSATWSKGYRDESLSPKSDLEENRSTLRKRTRDLAMNSPIGAAAINATNTSTIGPGLIVKPKIDYEYLGISRQQATEIERSIKREFSLWADSTLCDIADQNNFYELQQIAFSDWLRNGEAFVLILHKDGESNMPYGLKLKLVQADRVCTPGDWSGEYSGIDKKEKNGNRIMNGIEIDKDGRVVAYHISSTFPGEYGVEKQEWKRVKKRGEKTGNENILHIFNAETSEQYRGVPFLSPIIQTLKQTTRYTEAEITAALVNAILAVFIETEDGEEPDTGYGGEDDEETEDAWGTPIGGAPKPNDNEIVMGSGTVVTLKPGEKVEAVKAEHPSGSFSEFMDAMTTQMGAALEISPEVLQKKFGQNFSASKGALNESWRAFIKRRKWFVNDFCQVVYEQWLAEAVALGRVKAPGFFTDPMIRKAYANTTWTGPAQGCLNPMQEVNAATQRIAAGLSTREDECASMNGSEYEENIRTLIRENEQLAEANRAFEAKENSNGKDQH